MIFGGQIGGESMRLFLVYAAGNFIEATRETPYFQIGESKYGKPILDRVITPATTLEQAAKCARSCRWTRRSSPTSRSACRWTSSSAGRRALASEQIVCIDDPIRTSAMIHDTWGQRLRQVFEAIDDPQWNGGDAAHPLCVGSPRYEAMRKIRHPGEKIV